MLSGLVAIACYLSPNPTPLEMTVSGPKAEVAAVVQRALRAKGGKVLDRASGAQFDFARLRFEPTVRYEDFMSMMNAVQSPALLMSPPVPLVPDCDADGGAGGEGDSFAPVGVVGVFGEAKAVQNLRDELTWAKFSDILLADGRKGVAFEPTEEQLDAYQLFVADLPQRTDIEVVLVEAPRRGR